MFLSAIGCNQYSQILVNLLQTKHLVMVSCAARDVGPGHVNPSKEIEQDKIEVLKH